jgi:hypothetical protein
MSEQAHAATHLCHITYPYPDDSRCWPSRSGMHRWRLVGREEWPAIAWCSLCGLTLVSGEEGQLPRRLRARARRRFKDCRLPYGARLRLKEAAR